MWNIMEIDWKEVNMTSNGNKINLPKSVTIKFREKFKIRCLVKKRTPALSYHVKAKIYMVYIGFQSYARNSIRHARYSSRENGL